MLQLNLSYTTCFFTRATNLKSLRINDLATITDITLENVRLLKFCNGYLTVGSLTDRRVEHIVRY